MARRKRTTASSSEGWAATREPRGVIAQAAADRRRGLRDTDCRTPDGSSQAECPRPRRRSRSASKA
jgi:hypothetical protein